MNTITATYCAFCDTVTRTFENLFQGLQSYSVVISAARLAQMGYYEESQKLMNSLKDKK